VSDHHRGLTAHPLGFHFAQRFLKKLVSRGRHRSVGKMMHANDASQTAAQLSSDPPKDAELLDGEESVSTNRSFRSDVQGLRALAVTLVVLYHVGVPEVRGGFVGVDVFFVISGYVITALLLRERAKYGHTSLRDFYARRARRILPAATLVIVGTTIASFYYLGFIAGNQEASDASAAALFVSNFHFMHLGTDYASAQVPPSPLQNFWSLAVEEQFYFVYPAVFIICAKIVRRVRFDLKLITILALITIASFTWSIIQTRSNPAAAYFSPFTRAWELAVGGLVATVPSRLLGRNRECLSAFVTWFGMGGILYSAARFDDGTSFPGFAAAVPVIGTALVICAGTLMPRFGVGPFLSLRPVQWLGAISYGLYLVHWPILSISGERTSSKLSIGYALVLAALAVVICVVIYLVVERPIRHWRFLSARPVVSLALIPLCIGISLAIVAFEQYRYYLPVHVI
jgi:peptidoglycan/LPS O-acetylase OafA/YrhL